MPKPFAIHPGDILLTEFMEPLGLTAYRLAKCLHVSVPRINDLVRGKRSITADTAVRLGIYFGLPAQFWLNLQNEYDIRVAKQAIVDKIKPLLAALSPTRHKDPMHAASPATPTAELLLPEGNFKAYLFDLDGTLADSMPLHFRAWTKAVTDAGGTFPEAVFYELGGVPIVRVVEILNERFGYKMPPEETAHRKEQLYLDLLHEVQPIAAVVAQVHAMHGKIPLAIVSGSPRASIESTLKTLGLSGYFDTIVGSEDYIQGKPNPEPFLTAAARLGVAPADCLVFEDADAGIAAAQAAGMRWVRVPQPALR